MKHSLRISILNKQLGPGKLLKHNIPQNGKLGKWKHHFSVFTEQSLRKNSTTYAVFDLPDTFNEGPRTINLNAGKYYVGLTPSRCFNSNSISGPD